MDNEIGWRISRLRESRNLSQAQLSTELEKIGLKVRRETVTQWENGTRDLKTEYTIKLADFFGVSCDYILRGIEAENLSISEATGLSDAAVSRIRKLSMHKAILPDYHFSLSYIQNKVIAIGHAHLILGIWEYANKAYKVKCCKEKIISSLNDFHEPIPENLEREIAKWSLEHGSLSAESRDWVEAVDELNYSLFKVQETIKTIANSIREDIENG